MQTKEMKIRSSKNWEVYREDAILLSITKTRCVTSKRALPQEINTSANK